MSKPRDDLTPEQQAALTLVLQLVDFWRIEPHELTGPMPVRVVDDRPRPPRYRHPVSGETWDGQGAHPDWLRSALLKEGYTVDELRRAAAAVTNPG